MFWCYFQPHGISTRMSNVPAWNYRKTGTLVIIAPRTSSDRINRKTYPQWLRFCKFRKQLLQIPRITPEADDKEFMFLEQQEVEKPEATMWKKGQSNKRGYSRNMND